MPDKKAELQVALEEILDQKKGKHGNLFQIKIKNYKPMWISDQKILKEAVAAYLTGSPLPKKSYAVLPRSYKTRPVKNKMKSISSFFGKRSPPITSDVDLGSPEKKRSRSDGDKTASDVGKTKKRVCGEMLMAGWCGKARAYIKKFNTILDLKDKSNLVQVINEVQKELNPNKECLHLFRSENFQTGTAH